MTARPLLCLVMIVKNESRAIRATIESAKPFIDRYLVLDTGSTDGTQAIVREALADVPGELVEEPFVDFGATRSRALELAGAHTVFTLMLDGDETLQGGEALRAFGERHRDTLGPHHGAYLIKVQSGASTVDLPRLARTDASWRYVGVTRETLIKEKSPPPSIKVPDVLVVHEVAHRDGRPSRKRLDLDLRLLTEESKRRPGDPRTQFHLAQALEGLGNLRGAYAAYEKRLKMGGWQEEIYASLFHLARLSQTLRKPWPEVQQQFLDAHSHSPNRAEPLFAIAWHYYEKKNWPLTFLFASRGAQIAQPTRTVLALDPEVYRGKLLDLVGTAAFYVNEFEAGEAAIRKALADRPDDARLLRNLKFYEDRKKPKQPREPREPREPRRPRQAAPGDAAAAPAVDEPAAPAEDATAPTEPLAAPALDGGASAGEPAAASDSPAPSND